MRHLFVAALLLALSATLFAGEKPEAAKSTPQFDKLKSLVGTWKGKDDQGKTVTVTYRLVSNGSALMEMMSGEEHPDEMITMYHLNGTKLMLTHYCAAGNQPRMRASRTSKDGNTITFSYLDATNLGSANDMYMSGLVVTFKDDDHFSQQWTMTKDRKEAHHATFKYERVK